MQINAKQLYKKIPKPLKNMVELIGRYRIVNSKIFKKQYQLLEQASELNIDSLKKMQFYLLKETLQYAYENVPYYHEVFDDINFDVYNFSNIEEMKRIPYLNKDIIAKQWDKMQVNKINNFYYSTTGGTTGKSVKFAFDNSSLYKERAFVYHYWSKYGYNYKKSKLISFREVEFEGSLCKRNMLYNELLINPFMLDSKHIDNIIEEIYKFSGDFLYGYPSNIAIFCRLLKKNNIKFRLPIKAILLISENLYPDQKKQIEEVFDCPIAMFYGHTEKAVFAEKYGNSYHFNSLYGFTEILDSEEDNMVCTGFINRKMPLIRYKVDDKVIKKEDGYEIIGHRSNELLYGKDDYVISATTLEFSHEDCFEKVDAYQFEQSEIGKVTMRLESEQMIEKKELDAIKEKAKEKLPGFEINTVQTDKIVKTSRGKHKIIIQNITME